MLCWAESWDIYTEECYNKDTDAMWVSLSFPVPFSPNFFLLIQILINPFDKNYTNSLITLIQDDNAQANAVIGLIFETDSVMTSESRYSKPPIMSEADAVDCNTLKPYSYNKLEDPA